MHATNEDQLSRVIAPREGEENEPQTDPNAPLMPFPTSYVLDRDREDELVQHALKRYRELERDAGRNRCQGSEWYLSNITAGSGADAGTAGPQASWIGKRVLFEKTYRNEMDWRPSILGGIFACTNLVVPAARRICRQMVARAVNYFFGTSPWFAVFPVGVMDRELSDQTDRYTRWKLDQSKLQRTEEQAVERAFILGEAVVKTSFASRGQIYRTRATVLVDEQGDDILGADGDYILESDKWITDSAPDPANPQGPPIMAELAVLARDGKTPQPETMIWAKDKLITRRITHYKGPEAKVIHFMDFLCPLDAESVQEADICIHLYDMPVMTLADQWKKSIPADATAEEVLEANRRAVEMLRRIASTNGQKTSGQNSAAVDEATANTSTDSTAPILEIAECHLRYDADGDGLLEDVLLIIDLKTETPIFYDYEANVTPDGLRPFSVIRVNEVPGRWYGMGAMEMFQSSQEIVDLWMNRKSFASSGSGRVTFWDPSKTVEGKANKHLELNGGKTYTLNTGAKAEEVLSVVYLDDNKAEDLQKMIEFFMQLMMNESGIANANDGNVAGMDSTKLATGIRNVEKSGQELFGLYLGHLEPGISESLMKMVKILLANLDEMEVYRYFETGESKMDPLTGVISSGEGVQPGMREINPGDLANIEINTQVLLTRRRGEQVIESNTRIVELVEKFYGFAYEIQLVIVATFVEMAKQFQCPDAAKLFVPTQLPIAPPTGGLNPAGPTSTPRQSEPMI